MSKSLFTLSPNRYSYRFFGVDFFVNLCTGSYESFKYYSSTIDFNSVYRNEMISCPNSLLESMEMELSTKGENIIIGIYQNPDIYDAMTSIRPVLEILEKYNAGLYLETSSMKVLDDLELLKEFAKNHPLLIGIPVSSDSNYDNPIIFPEKQLFSYAKNIMKSMENSGLNYGAVIKPIIPYLNDRQNDFIALIKKLATTGVKFIYPSFALHFDSKKSKAFYDAIDLYNPELKVKYMEEFGYRNAWVSQNTVALKKEFVFECRKAKVLFSMKDIINSYKPDLNVQLKLF